VIELQDRAAGRRILIELPPPSTPFELPLTSIVGTLSDVFASVAPFMNNEPAEATSTAPATPPPETTEPEKSHTFEPARA